MKPNGSDQQLPWTVGWLTYVDCHNNLPKRQPLTYIAKSGKQIYWDLKYYFQPTSITRKQP